MPLLNKSHKEIIYQSKEEIFENLFKHLILAKGLNNLVSLERYSEEK